MNRNNFCLLRFITLIKTNNRKYDQFDFNLYKKKEKLTTKRRAQDKSK